MSGCPHGILGGVKDLAAAFAAGALAAGASDCPATGTVSATIVTAAATTLETSHRLPICDLLVNHEHIRRPNTNGDSSQERPHLDKKGP